MSEWRLRMSRKPTRMVVDKRQVLSCSRTLISQSSTRRTCVSRRSLPQWFHRGAHGWSVAIRPRTMKVLRSTA